MPDTLETMLLDSPAVIAVQKGGVLSIDDAAHFLGIAMQCCAITRRLMTTFHKSQENLRKQFAAAQVKTVDGDYEGLERDPGVVGNQPGQDNTLVRTPHGTLRWAEGEEGQQLNEAHMKQVNREYAKEQWARAKANPLSGQETV